MVIARIARGMAWTIGVLLVLAVLGYAALWMVNRHDQPPSPVALRLQHLLDARPAVAEADNGYVDALGLAAPRDQDPRALGRQRKAFLDALVIAAPTVVGFALPGRDIDYRALRTPQTVRLARACTHDGQACLDALARDPAALDDWLAADAWLLARYRAMLQRGAWRETPPIDIRAPLPAYAPLLDAQQLLLLDALRRARAGDVDGVRALLQDDLRYWRMVLASSDLLITKVIATAAIERHFMLGNLALRALPPAVAATAIPPAWRTPLSAPERSLLHALAGEWRLVGGALASVGQASPAVDQQPLLERIDSRLSAPLLKRQATLNLVASRFVATDARALRPYAELPRLLAASDPGSRPPLRALLHPYNPVGHVLAATSGDDSHLRYAVRVADLEGLRRVTLLATELRAGDPASRAARLQASPWKDPYTGTGFGWDAATQALVVEGLAPGEHQRKRVPL